MFSTLDSRGKTREQPDEIRVWHARNQLRQPKNENSNAKTCWTLENECPANPPEDARQEPGVKRGSPRRVAVRQQIDLWRKEKSIITPYPK
jgi:hypothetical protein